MIKSEYMNCKNSAACTVKTLRERTPRPAGAKRERRFAPQNCGIFQEYVPALAATTDFYSINQTEIGARFPRAVIYV